MAATAAAAAAAAAVSTTWYQVLHTMLHYYCCTYVPGTSMYHVSMVRSWHDVYDQSKTCTEKKAPEVCHWRGTAPRLLIAQVKASCGAGGQQVTGRDRCVFEGSPTRSVPWKMYRGPPTGEMIGSG